MNHSRLEELLQKWLTKTSDENEEAELMHFFSLQESEEQRLFFAEAVYKHTQTEQKLSKEDADRIVAEILNKNVHDFPVHSSPVHRVHFLKTAWFRYAAAIIIVLGTSTYFLFRDKVPSEVSTPVLAREDVSAPSSDSAVLTLANGEQISIGGSSAGVLAQDANVQIHRNDKGEIIYGTQSATESTATQYNILTVPRGGRIATILLSDGTRVFLNSASSLKYPVHFSSKERRVELSGEAYFEVAPNAKSKFVVSDGKMLTEVLGTSFNVNTYPDEMAATVTLLTGAVKINKGNNAVILKPGEQCTAEDAAPLKVSTANIEEAVAWKDGYFQFEQATLGTIAKEVSRWYNVNFIFENKLAAKETFHAKFSRNSSLSELLKILEFTDVKFEIKGNEVIIN